MLKLKRLLLNLISYLTPVKFNLTAGDIGSLNTSYCYGEKFGKVVIVHFWVTNLPTSASGEPCIFRVPQQYAPSASTYFACAFTQRVASPFSNYGNVNALGNGMVSAGAVANNTQLLGTVSWVLR